MSSEKQPSPIWDDDRITAYVMDELTGDEKRSFEAEMSRDDTLVAAVDQAQQVTAKLAAFYAAMPEEKLDADRLDTFTDHSGSVAKRSRWSPTWIEMVVAAGIVFVLMGLMIPAVNSSRETNSTLALRMEDEAAGMPAANEAIDSEPIAESRYAEEQKQVDSQVEASQGETAAVSVGTEVPASMPAKDAASRSLQNEPPVEPSMKPSAPPATISSRSEVSKRFSTNESLSPSGALAGGYALPRDTTKIRDEHPFGESSHPFGESSQRREQQLPDAIKQVPQGTGPGMSGDKFDPITENDFKRVAEHPLSTLSIDVDTASYSKIRMSLQNNYLPRPDAVRIEEMINYFGYDYEKVSDTLVEKSSKWPDPFVADLAVTSCPWQPEHRLVRVGLQAVGLEKNKRPRCNLVFLIDNSGSMRAANKLPLVIDGMKLLLDELRDDDQVAIVVYAGSAGLVLDSTPVKKRKKILKALSALQSGGSTNGGAGLRLAYNTARENLLKDGVNRVILCSDGDFNVGMTGTDELVREAKTQAKSGIDLTVLGFGMGNHNDAMMERISNDAEGNYGFIDTIGEAQKVLVDQLSGTLVTVAKDVKIQIEFNPAVVSSYRLIGYENRLLAKEDFNDDTKDAGEIGAGHRVTALYEIVPAGKTPASLAPPVDALKYQSDSKSESASALEPALERSKEMLTLKLRYKPPQGDTSKLIARPLVDGGGSFEDADADFRFAAAVAGFGMQLRNSTHAGSWTYDDVIRTARSSLNGDSTGENDPHGLRAEMVELVEKAKALTVLE